MLSLNPNAAHRAPMSAGVSPRYTSSWTMASSLASSSSRRLSVTSWGRAAKLPFPGTE